MLKYLRVARVLSIILHHVWLAHWTRSLCVCVCSIRYTYMLDVAELLYRSILTLVWHSAPQANIYRRPNAVSYFCDCGTGKITQNTIFHSNVDRHIVRRSYFNLFVTCMDCSTFLCLRLKATNFASFLSFHCAIADIPSISLTRTTFEFISFDQSLSSVSLFASFSFHFHVDTRCMCWTAINWEEYHIDLNRQKRCHSQLTQATCFLF